MRVFLRQWKDKYEGKGPMITHRESVCPDDECQKIVEQKFAAIREMRELTEERRRNTLHRKRMKASP